MVFGGKFRIRRCNSKASYLPRQSREKLNTDPDHGVYKLTLTSNEDCINDSNVFPVDILTTKCNNLPDVLPLGAKVQSASPRFGSNNNLNNVNHLNKTPQTAPVSYSMKSMFHFNLNNNNRHSTSPTLPPYPRGTTESISPKYMSQSTIDLKKTHVLGHSDTNKMSSSDSESSLIDATPKKQSPYSVRNEFVGRKLSLDERTNSPCNIPMVVHRTSTPIKKDDKVIRKDSLKENIDKITQLQSKLMSAHLNENEKMISNLARETNQRNSICKLEKTVEIDPLPVVKIFDTKHTTAVPQFDHQEKLETTTHSLNSDVDGLKLLQRTEIVLRLNASTSEAASQTDDSIEDVSNMPIENDESNVTVSSRLQFSDDLDCEKLSKDLVKQLSPTDRLHNILAPKIFKYSSDYVSELYNPHITPRHVKKDAATSTPEKSPDHVNSSTKPVTHNASFFVMPEVKSKQRFTREVTTLINGDSGDLTKQKEELVSRISQKLIILTNEQATISDEITANEMLGNDVAIKVTQTVRPIDASKFRSYVDDVGHITMLLLSLSGRLARTENALQNICDDIEKKSLEIKRDRLIEQLNEAKRLKEDIDQRGSSICRILEKNLSIEDYADYNYFINMKAKLIVDSREISDKIKLGDEQLSALKDTLVHSEC